MAASESVIDGFADRVVDVGDVRIACSVAGHGPPVLLLHGYPQMRAMWRRVAPALAERHTVVAADLRGYGDSDKPVGGPPHDVYSKRAMAVDQVRLMSALGHDAFAVVGHDRGGRVAHRMARDHRDRVRAMAVLDIVPTARLFDEADASFATAYYHWFFLIQPDGLPERLIGGDPEWFLRETVSRWAARHDQIHERDMLHYVRCFADASAIHASCEDYRAAASIDLEHDASDEDAPPVDAPLLVLWGARGAMARLYDVLGTWSAVGRDVRGRALDCGHFLPEERAEETAEALLAFLASCP